MHYCKKKEGDLEEEELEEGITHNSIKNMHKRDSGDIFNLTE